MIVAKMQQRNFSLEALLAGLPLEGKDLSPELFHRAAERAGFLTKVVHKKLDEIESDHLPLIALLKDDQAVLISKFLEKGKVELILPQGQEQVIDLEELEEKSLSQFIFLKALPRMEHRQDDLIPQKEGSLSWFWNILWRNQAIYSDVALAAVFINLFVIASPLYVMNVYDRVIPNAATETLWVLAFGISIVYFFDCLLKILRAYLIDIAGKRSDIILSNQIFEHIMNFKLSNRPKSAGAFANLVRDFESVRDFFTSATLATCIDIPFVFLFIGIVYLIGGALAYVLFVAVLLILVINVFVQAPLARAINEDLKGSGSKHGLLVESINNLEQIKVMNAQSFQQKRWEDCVGALSHSSGRSRLLSSMALYSSTWVQQMVTVVLVIVGVYMVIAGSLSQGALIACVILSGRAIAPMGQMASFAIRYQRARQGLEGMNQLMNTPLEGGARHQKHTLGNLKGKIEFQGVCFAYHEEQEAVLKDVSFQINPGERVGLIGKVGSGKSTCLKLILGLFEATKGKIFFDGTVQQQYEAFSIRSSMGYVPQHSHLFFGSIFDNIMMANPKDEKNIERALQLSCLSNFLEKCPMGIHLPIGERGEGISQGQAQMICIARGLVNDAPILLLDEPTSSLDHNTEASIVQNLQQYLSSQATSQTLLLVTHKIPLLSLVDRLLLFDEGRLVLDGPKREVIARLSQNMEGSGLS